MLPRTTASRKQDRPSSFRSETIFCGSTPRVYADVGRLQGLHATTFGRLRSASQTGSMSRKSPKAVLSFLIEGRPDLQHETGELNSYALERVIEKRLGRTVSQSTLNRLWRGEVEEMRADTVDVLAEFFGVPESVIRGELTVPQLDSLGMDITLAEVQFLERMRQLSAEHRHLVDSQVRALQPHSPDREPPKTPSPAAQKRDSDHTPRKNR